MLCHECSTLSDPFTLNINDLDSMTSLLSRKCIYHRDIEPFYGLAELETFRGPNIWHTWDSGFSLLRVQVEEHLDQDVFDLIDYSVADAFRP